MPEGDNNNPNPGNDQGNPPGNPGKTFTQAELDQIISDRLGRERQKYGDYDELKRAANELKTLKAAQMTEAEKLQAQLKELADANSSLTREVRAARAMGAAQKAGALYPDAVARLLPDAAFEEDGKGLEAALGEIKKSYPGLFKAGAGSADGGAQGPPGKVDMNAMLRQAVRGR